MKKLLALLLTLCVLCSLALPAFAAGDTIDTSKTGSLTLYKYDMTSATGAGLDLSAYVSTGEANSAAEAALAAYAIQGVKFTYLKIADISNQTTGSTGSADVSLLYGMTQSDKTAALLTAIGLSYDDAYSSSNGTYYFTSDVLQEALSTSLQDSTAAKNVLES